METGDLNNNSEAADLPDEIFGALRLRRSTGKSGYYGVYGPSKSKKRPYQALGGIVGEMEGVCAFSF